MGEDRVKGAHSDVAIIQTQEGIHVALQISLQTSADNDGACLWQTRTVS